MRSQLSYLLTLAPAVLVRGEDVKITFWKEADCSGDKLEWETFNQPSGDSCGMGTVIPANDWEFNSQGDWKAHINGAPGMPADCKIGITQQASVQPDKCGLVFITIDGAQQHQCREVWLPQNIGAYYCCGKEQCDQAGVNGVAARNALENRSPAPKSPSKPAARPAARDVTAIKRTAPLASRADCKWNGGPTYQVRGDPVTVVNNLHCPAGTQDSSAPCHVAQTSHVGVSMTETWGISVEMGASFMEIVSASTTFSYSYSYTKDESSDVSVTMDIPAGSDGYITFSQSLECTKGKFTGTCDWAADQDGETCIPLKLPGGQAKGELTFVRSI